MATVKEIDAWVIDDSDKSLSVTVRAMGIGLRMAQIGIWQGEDFICLGPEQTKQLASILPEAIAALKQNSA